MGLRLRFGDSIYMQSRFPSLLTPVGGWVVGKLESYAKLNSKLRLKLKLELSLAILLNVQNDFLRKYAHYGDFMDKLFGNIVMTSFDYQISIFISYRENSIMD